MPLIQKITPMLEMNFQYLHIKVKSGFIQLKLLEENSSVFPLY
jgi:hypothetical protein